MLLKHQSYLERFTDNEVSFYFYIERFTANEVSFFIFHFLLYFALSSVFFLLPRIGAHHVKACGVRGGVREYKDI